MYGGGSSGLHKDKKKKGNVSGNNKKKSGYWGNTKNKKGTSTPIDIRKTHSVNMGGNNNTNSNNVEMATNWNNNVMQNSYNSV